MKPKYMILFVISISLLMSSSLFAKEMTAEEIIKESYDHNMLDFDAATANMKMDSIEGPKVVEVRKLRVKAMQKIVKKEKLRRVIMAFVEPEDVAGTSFLTMERPDDANDDQFLYLPALKKVLRKGGKTGKGESFMGTQFTFGDMSSKDVNKAKHKRLPDEKLNNIDCYVIESIPNDPKEDKYSKYISWINKKTFVAMRIKLFDLKNRFQKVMMTEKVELVDNRHTTTQMTMLNVINKKATRIYITNIKTKAKLDEADFTKERMTKL